MRGIGALVMEKFASDGSEPPVRIDGNLYLPVLVPLLDRAEKMFSPVLDPLDWPVEHFRSCNDSDLLRVDHELAAESATDLARDHAHLVGSQIQHFDDVVAQFMRNLCRRPNTQRPGTRIDRRQNAPPLDRMRDAPMLGEAF